MHSNPLPCLCKALAECLKFFFARPHRDVLAQRHTALAVDSSSCTALHKCCRKCTPRHRLARWPSVHCFDQNPTPRVEPLKCWQPSVNPAVETLSLHRGLPETPLRCTKSIRLTLFFFSPVPPVTFTWACQGVSLFNKRARPARQTSHQRSSKRGSLCNSQVNVFSPRKPRTPKNHWHDIHCNVPSKPWLRFTRSSS